MVADRRKSFAVSSEPAEPSSAKKRRRAYSIAPGDHINRRSIAPRKSILKRSLNFPANDDEDETIDYTTEIRDNNTTQRTLLARRVSFAERTHVRVFKKSKKNSNDSTNSTTSPLSSSPADVVVTDENAYPGRRRSSVRKSVAYSEGEASMEVDDDDEDAVGPSAFMFAKGDSALADDDQEEEYDDDGEDMEMTEAISQNIIRKRSLSLNPQPRRPLSNVPHKPLSSPTNTNPSSEPDHSYTDDNSTSTSISTTDDHPLEYTVPLVKPPAPPSDAWLKLRSVTHSGDTPYQAPLSDDDGGEGGEEAMELTDAVQRLLVARRSLGAVQQEDSFASTNDSLLDDDDEEEEGGDHTVNVTALVRRASMGTTASEAGDSTMEVTGDYGAGIIDQAGRLSVGPVHPQPPLPPSASKPRIFTPLSPSKLNKPPGQHATVPQPFTFTLPPKSQPQASPSKIPFPVFSAAPTTSRTSPKKRSAPVDENQNVNGGIEPEDRPSPAKKLAVAGRWPDTSTPRAAAFTPKAPPSASKTPSRLSPSKKAPFLAQQQQTLTDANKPVGSVRRPSGYLAQRKSWVPPPNDDVVEQNKSPAKKAGNGKASTIRFDVVTEKEIAQRDEEARARSRSPPRVLSPAPKASRAASPTNEIDQDEDAVMQIVNPAAQWREDVQEQSFSSEEDGPHISIEQFFNMTGIRFMDEITAPRRSTIHPSALRPRRHSSPSSTFPADSDIPLAEYVTAMSVDVPQLELYTYVSKDLEAWIERSKGIFLEAEAEAEKITPELFREFVAAGEDGQAELLHQLKLIKANTHGNAKSEWYDWKLQWVGQLFGKAEKGFTDLTEDAKALEVITKQAQALVPSLREEYDQITRELEQEKVLVAEIENSDQKYLSELKNTISEQNAELEAFRADVAEGNAKLERLEEKLQELDLQKREATGAIEKAQRLLHIQKNSTRAEVFRLKDELETLENLHLWHAVKVHPDFLEFIYASMYRVSIPCVKFKPVVQELNIKRLDHVTTKFKDPFPQLSDLMLRMAKQTVIRDGNKMSIRKVTERLSDYWSSCAQLRSQLKLVAIKYPLSVEITPPRQDGTSGFNAIATIIFPNIKAKALVSFILDMDTFSSWPMSIGETECEVEVSYGPIKRDTIFNAVKGRLRQATPADNHACLLDACIEAMDQYA